MKLGRLSFLSLAAGLGMTFAMAQPSPEAPAAPVPAEKTKPAPATPAVEAPKPEAAKPAPAPQTAAPKTETPKVETPKVEAPAPTPVESKVVEKPGEYTGKVVVIPVGQEDLVSPARFEFMSRTLKRATEEGAEAVIFDLDTPGGLAWDTTTFIMQDLQKLGTKSYAFVNPRALSAGAFIALGTDAIYMGTASSIRAATPVSGSGAEMGEAERAKMNSAIMAMARTVAKAKGHNPAVIEAMIDKDIGLTIDGDEICAKGRILTLDQEQAIKTYGGKPLLAKAIVKNLAELKQKEGLKGETITAEPKGFERVAIWITQYAAILILIGLAGGYIEMQHPGFGVPGIISAIAFGIFFFGHYVAGSLIGYETLVIFLVGLLLLVIEFFVFPGHVLPGLAGLLMVFGSLIYTMAGWDVTIPEGGVFPVRAEDYLVPLRNLGFAFVGAIALVMVLMRFLPQSTMFKHFILQTAVGGAQASIEGDGQREAKKITVGMTGKTRSAMRPYGNVVLEDIPVEAMVEGDYLGPNVEIKVRSVHGGKITVERV